MSFMDRIKDGALESMAPNTMALAREIDKQAENNPAQAQALESLTAALKAQSGNVRGISTLEKLLGNDAQFKSQVRALALQNPAALEKILPQALSNPDSMKTLVAQTAAAHGPARTAAPSPVAASPVAAATPQAAPRVQSAAAPARPEAPAAAAPRAAPVEVAVAPVAATPAPSEPAAAAAAPAQNGALPRLSEMTDLDKLAELSEVAGYNDLMDRIEKNPDLGAMFDSLMSGSEDDPAARTKALDDILHQTRKNPDMLSDLVKTIDEKPGVVSSIAGMAANDPKMAMTALGMYSQFNQGFGKMLDGLFGPGVLDKLLVSLMGTIAPMLSNSNALMLTSNNGGSLTRNVMNALGGNPAEVHSVAPENGDVTTRTGEDFKKEGERNIAEAQTPPDPQNRNLPGANPMAGPQPAV